jgi:hypothetical protein
MSVYTNITCPIINENIMFSKKKNYINFLINYYVSSFTFSVFKNKNEFWASDRTTTATIIIIISSSQQHHHFSLVKHDITVLKGFTKTTIWDTRVLEQAVRQWVGTEIILLYRCLAGQARVVPSSGVRVAPINFC